MKYEIHRKEDGKLIAEGDNEYLIKMTLSAFGNDYILTENVAENE